jgi:tetratricopeptide (TPR) repeat protein
MVLPAPPAHASPVEARWFDRIGIAIELATRGVLTLVDNAAPSRLREAYLRLRARDPATDVIVDVRRLAELPLGATAILALASSMSSDDLEWLNLNRPILSDRRLSVVLWCEGGAAAALSQHAPDFFDWISARVDCPPAPAAHAVANVKRAICARASGIAWDGPGLEDTLAAIRPSRPIRRVLVASYQSMFDALTSRERGWLFLEGIETAFHLRRLRWAMVETGRRLIVFRRAFGQTAPGWWNVHARHVPIIEAVHAITAVGGAGRLAALTGLDPDACAYVRSALGRGCAAAYLEELLATASEPRMALQNFATQLGLTVENGMTVHEGNDDWVLDALSKRPSDPGLWTAIGAIATADEDPEVAIRWLTEALRLLPDDRSSLRITSYLLRGTAHHSAGDVVSAREDFEHAYSIASFRGDTPSITTLELILAYALLEQGQASRARELLESALGRGVELGDEGKTAELRERLAKALLAQGDLGGARLQLERVLSIKQRIIAADDPTIADTLSMMGIVLTTQGDMEGARPYLERSLEITERLRGADHPSIVVTLRTMAEVHRATGDLKSARAHLERALALQRAVSGSDEHPEFANTLVALARVIAADGDLDGAQAMLERALATQQLVFGDDGQLAGAKARRALADVLAAKGDLVGPIEHLERALVTLRKIFQRDEHPDIAAVLHELERLQKLQSELQRAD